MRGGGGAQAEQGGASLRRLTGHELQAPAEGAHSAARPRLVDKDTLVALSFLHGLSQPLQSRSWIISGPSSTNDLCVG